MGYEAGRESLFVDMYNNRSQESLSGVAVSIVNYDFESILLNQGASTYANTLCFNPNFNISYLRGHARVHFSLFLVEKFASVLFVLKSIFH